jgi:DTW domain-containing protein
MARDVCDSCGRLTSVCICTALVKVSSAIRVVILQHPSELKQPLATVPLLQRCLSPCEVWVGENFTGSALQAELLAELQTNPTSVRLLFPDDVGSSVPARPLAGEVKILLVIDGTWRKARKILHINPWLLSLPRLALQPEQSSRYRIRQSKLSSSLATLEAVSFALHELTGDAQMLQLLRPFEAMIDLQIKKMGAEVFRAHYQVELE